MNESAPPAGALPLAARLPVVVRHEERNERIAFACGTSPLPPIIASAADRRWLGPWETRHAAELKFAKRRDEFLLGRYVAKCALLEWLGSASLAALDIVPGAFQQPIVHGAAGPPVGVTLAHSGRLAVAIAHEAGHPMGIDLERNDPSRLHVVRSQVADAEVPADGGLLDESARFFLLWAAKEALSKALRCGLTCPFELLATQAARIDATGICTGTFVNFGQYQFLGWMLGDYAFAVVGAKRAGFAAIAPALQSFTRQATQTVP